MSKKYAYLQMLGGFFIAGHKHKLGTDAAEMHVAQKSCTLYCGFICRLERTKEGLSYNLSTIV